MSKNIRLNFVIWCLIGIWFLVLRTCPLSAEQDTKVVTLTKQIMDAKTGSELYPYFEELSGIYFRDNRYQDFVDFLGSLSNKKKSLSDFTDYYAALSRYRQLKYLEESQNWDEYFSKGNDYRDDITESLKNAINASSPQDPLRVYSALLSWKFHRDQQDVFHEQALTDLMNSVLEYAKTATDIGPIKEVADTLAAYEEKGKSRELLKIFVDKLVASGLKDEELVSMALKLFEEGNTELSESIYNIYIERLAKSPKEKLTPALIDIAKRFSYKDTGAKDELYAEQIFAKIEELSGKEAFDENLLYVRAFNLEKARDYNKAKDIYSDLITRYPKTNNADEAEFKCGIIYTYILRDIKTGRAYFEKLSQKEALSPQVITSLYQLGLLSQWEVDPAKAKEYYNKLLEKAKEGFAETVASTRDRLKEIDEARPIEYNLKTFLDLSLKEENAMFNASKSEIRSSLYRPKKNEGIKISATAYTEESGCMQVELQYLWSGSTGTAKPLNSQSSFDTSFLSPGTNVINLVVVSSSGIIDRNIDIVDSY